MEGRPLPQAWLVLWRRASSGKQLSAAWSFDSRGLLSIVTQRTPRPVKPMALSLETRSVSEGV